MVRTKALTTLKDVLTKHELDTRINNADKRARVAGLYFPLFSIVKKSFLFPLFFFFLIALLLISIADCPLPPIQRGEVG